MGAFDIRKIRDHADRNRMYGHAIKDILAFEEMIRQGMFTASEAKIGAEQELCIVGKDRRPAMRALDLLSAIDDEHYTNELALYNLEINLDPLPLQGECLSSMESDLHRLLAMAEPTLRDTDTRLLMAGILPTLRYHDLSFEHMTPEPRYQTLSDELAQIRGEDFRIHVQGTDELIMSLDSVLFEACNTSFQLHLQIAPEEFVHRYNWAQHISGPVLSICANSPLLFGYELWAETRVAIFKQSIDTRSAYKHIREKLPRVYFGKGWLEKSPAELWKNDLMRFPMILTRDVDTDSLTQLERGEVPRLDSIRLHNGTTYTWNRMCYGHHGSAPHLRIECRYIPSGPTVKDEIANLALWIGLMNAPPQGEFWKDIDFREAQSNFYNAARGGLNTIFRWNRKYVSASDLMLHHLLPLAYQGLAKTDVASQDASTYLGIIEQRILKHQTGADWQVQSYHQLTKRMHTSSALQYMTEAMLDYQQSDTPVHEWEPCCRSHHITDTVLVDQVMSQDIIAVPQDMHISHAQHIMQWKNIHHLPVENDAGDLVGLITDGIILRQLENERTDSLIRDVMITDDLITVVSSDTIAHVQQVMSDHGIQGIPVVHGGKLVGIVTDNDV